MLKSKFTTLLLVAVCALLANLIYSRMFDPQITSEMKLNKQSSQLELKNTSVAQANHLADRSDFDEITQRPLFSSTRQPEEKEEEEVFEDIFFEPPVQQPDFKLVGIVLSPEENMALIQSENESNLQRVMLNETIEGWELIKINPNLVELGSGDQLITLEIEREANPNFYQEGSSTIEQAENKNDLNEVDPAPENLENQK